MTSLKDVRDLVANAAAMAKYVVDRPELANRWLHVQAVGRRAEELAVTVNPDERPTLVAAAWLHDIGYSPEVVDTGLHSLDGARYLQRHGYPSRIVALVAHHTAARFEAGERGLGNELSAYICEDSPVMDALCTADLTTGPRGEEFVIAERLNEILNRYSPETAVHRAITKARPVLERHVTRAMDRLARLMTQP